MNDIEVKKSLAYVCDNIQRRRTQLRLNPTSLSRQAGVSRQHIYQIEAGRIPSLVILAKLAVPLKTSVIALVTEKDR